MTGVIGEGVELSVVIPAAEDVAQTWEQVRAASAELARLGRSAEFVVILEGSGHYEGELPELPAGQRLVLVSLAKPFGESVALAIGFERSRGSTVVTLGREPQVELEAIEEALRRIEEGRADVLVGRREPRLGSWPNRVQSAVYHRLVQLITGSRYHDLGCAFRVMRRATALELDLYGNLHRFVPVLAENLGFRVQELEVRQHPRDRPRGVYGPRELGPRLLDGLTILFVAKFIRRPLRFFGMIGFALAAPGAAILLYLAAYRILGFGGIAERPVLLLGILLTVLGVQSLSIGLLGEVIIFTHARKLRSYRVLEQVVGGARGQLPKRAGDAGLRASM